MKLIVAVDNNWGIGKNGDLLLSIPEDMRFFREKTRSAVLVMGYNTLLSFPNGKPLPFRMNIVLNDAQGVVVPRTVICKSIPQLFELIKDMNGDDVFVIGGGSIYRQLLPYCDTAYITKMRFDGGADTFIPNLDELPEWTVSDESELFDHDGLKYSFVEYRNSSPKAVGFTGVNADMPPYFCKKTELEIDVLTGADKAYYDELSVLLHAYFKPLADGIGSEEVDGFISAGRGTFEDYLKAKGCIAGESDFAALNGRYDLEKTLAVRTVRVSRDDFLDFLSEL